jgi:hypothetical protein
MRGKDSYIVVSKATGKAVFEFFTEELKKHINTENYHVVTAAAYLPTLNNGK